MVTLCFDEHQWAWAVDSAYQNEVACAVGVYLGPPDLTEMELPHMTMLLLREKLVKADLYNAETILNQRPRLLSVCGELQLTKRQVQRLISIYQRDFYGDG